MPLEARAHLAAISVQARAFREHIAQRDHVGFVAREGCPTHLLSFLCAPASTVLGSADALRDALLESIASGEAAF
jgi:hypothetical protein